jgi:predicted RecB family nuclease
MKNLYSPSMIKNYLNCEYIIFNEINEKKLNLKKKEKTISSELRFKKGNIHEDNYLQLLKSKYKKVIDIKNLKISREEKFDKTISCMKEGYEIIRGGYLKKDKWIGEFDFLEINKKLPSKFGNYSYEVLDTKNTSKAKTDHIIQIGMYTFLLESIQGVLPKIFTIVLKDMKKEVVQLNQVYEFFKINKEKYEHFVLNEINKSTPQKCDFCLVCPWLDTCEKIWKDKDDLNQIGGMNKNYSKKLREQKIKTASILSRQDEEKKLEGLRSEISRKLIIQAKLQKEYEKTGKPVFRIYEDNLNKIKGFNLLPRESKCDLFFDIESVPDYVVPGKLEYLFGFYYIENDKEKFKPIWAHTKKEEKNNVLKFFDFTKKHFEKYPDAKIYHYASYEITALERLTSFHQVNMVEYDHYIILGKFVDLFRVTKQALLVSENSYSIKNLEKFYNFKRSGDLQKGDISQDYYTEWMENKDQKLLDEIEEYNKQDCESTYQLRNWLLKVKPENTRWFLSSKEEMELRDNEIKMLEYQKKISNTQIENKSIKEIITSIIGYYNRENKPEWREYFDRKHLTDDELIDDPTCIGNMHIFGSQVQEKRSLIYTYKYEDQEFKIKAGKEATLANNLDPEIKDRAGSIISIDHDKKIVTIKRGTSQGRLQDNISIGPPPPFKTDKLEASTYKFIDSVIEKKNKYNALISILLKQNPKIKGIKEGDKIIKTHDFTSEIPKIISNLDNSYIYIQGPPGTGKTTQASNAIVELLKSNKKIGITANSHKVIHNLLDKIENISSGVPFRGLKMGRSTDEDTIYNSQHIKTSSNEKDFIDGLNSNNTLIYAGTKYHFSSSYYDSKLDYLFIDEAGQVSLADIIAIGSVAKNIVLIGDQLQLGQPIKGSHPGESGKSILDFLLEGKDTIPAHRGIFLNKTYRLNSKINEFISNNFYEDKLVTDVITDKRKISFDKKHIIKKEGVHHISMDHKDNIQKSIEEGQVIKKILNEMIGLKYFDGAKDRKLTLEDFLIISPYNAQVNYLMSVLKNAKVGTIDKFQGQEAAVTIISMTSSDSDILPRNKEFFFNRNRLNVAISRAQCVSIILFNPELLKTSPRSVEQIKLLNNFYKLLKYK